MGLFLFILGNRNPGLTIFEYSLTLLGGFIGRLAAGAYILFFIQVAVLMARSLDESLLLIMPETPVWVFAMVMVSLAGLAVYNGLEVIGRLAELIGVILLFLAGVVPLLAINMADFGNLLPLLQSSPPAIIKAGLLMTSFFGVCIVMGVLMAYLKHPEAALKVKAGAVVASGLLMLAVDGVALAIFGAQTISTVIHISFNVARLISIRAFFERLEALNMVLWVSGGFLTIAIVYYCAALGLAQILKLRRYQIFTLPLGVVIIALTLWEFDNRVGADRFVLQVFMWYALAVEAGLTAILLVVSLLRPKKKKV